MELQVTGFQSTDVLAEPISVQLLFGLFPHRPVKRGSEKERIATVQAQYLPFSRRMNG